MLEVLLRPLLPHRHDSDSGCLAVEQRGRPSVSAVAAAPPPSVKSESSRRHLRVRVAPAGEQRGPVVSVAVNGERRQFPLEERAPRSTASPSMLSLARPACSCTPSTIRRNWRAWPASPWPRFGLGFQPRQETLVLPQQGVGLHHPPDNGTAGGR